MAATFVFTAAVTTIVTAERNLQALAVWKCLRARTPRPEQKMGSPEKTNHRTPGSHAVV
jgi:hypothetical protein